MTDLFRESTAGQLLNWVSRGRILPYPEQKPDWQVPAAHLFARPTLKPARDARDDDEEASVSRAYPIHVPPPATGLSTALGTAANSVVDVDVETCKDAKEQGEKAEEVDAKEQGEKADEVDEPPRLQSRPCSTVVDDDLEPMIVGWYGDDDPDNPQNWSFLKKCIVSAGICLLTFSIYIGSAIYTSSIPGVMEEFNVSLTKAELGLSLFVLGYAISPMIFSPLSELPSIGRNVLYVTTLAVFVAVQIPAALSKNYSTLMAMRFLSGFFGSPALSIGGASIQDIWSSMQVPYVVGLWACAAVMGPVLGPVMGGFAAMNVGWRWTLWIMLMISGLALLVLLFVLPETFGPTILHRRAQRIRKRARDKRYVTEGELKQSNVSTSSALFEALLRPIQLALEPAVFFANLYIGLAYGIFYLWFEAFPLVFVDRFHFNLGEQGLPFLSLLVSGVLAYIFYACYQRYVVLPRFVRTGTLVPETRLEIALLGCWIPPISLFIFGWTAKASASYWGPVIGAGLYLPGVYLVFQGVIVYLPLSYPDYAASVLASNTLVRSVFGAAFPLFARAMYDKLGIAGGCSLLAGLSIFMIPFLYALYRTGARLRSWSKYATA